MNFIVHKVQYFEYNEIDIITQNPSSFQEIQKNRFEEFCSHQTFFVVLVFDEDGMIINQIFCTLNFFQVLIFQSSIDFILNESWKIHLFLAPELRSFPGRTGYLLRLSRLDLQGIPGEKIK